MRVLILPDNLLRRAIDLDDARVRRALAPAERPIVEDQDAAVVELAGAVLLCDDARVEMPDDGAGGARDDDDGGDAAQRGEDVAVLEREDGVDERPVLAGVVGLEREELRVEVLDGLPGPDELVVGVDVFDAVAVGFAVGCFAVRNAAWDGLCLFFCEGLERGVQNAAVVHVVLVMVCKRIAMFSNHFSERINLLHHTSSIFLPQRERTWCIGMHSVVGQVSVLQDSCMTPRSIWEIPMMCFCSIVRDQSNCAGAREMGKESVTW